MDRCRRISTSSMALGEMSTSIQHRPKFSAAKHAVAQPQVGQPKGAGPENSPPLLPNEGTRPASSRESRRRQALIYPDRPSCGAGGVGLLGPGVCGLGGADTLNIGRSLWQDCTCIVPLRVSSSADEGDSTQHSFRTTGFQPFLP